MKFSVQFNVIETESTGSSLFLSLSLSLSLSVLPLIKEIRLDSY